MDARFAVETFAAVRQEAEALAAAHWDETEAALYGDRAGVPLSVPMFESMEAAGILHIVTARDAEGRMAGYAAFCLSENMAMPGRIQASNLGLYLSPALRGDPFTALRLLRWAEQSLRARGVRSVAYISPVSRPCDALYRRLGAKMTETTWHKEL